MLAALLTLAAIAVLVGGGSNCILMARDIHLFGRQPVGFDLRGAYLSLGLDLCACTLALAFILSQVHG